MEAMTLRELLEAVGGTLIGPAAGLEQTVSHVDTDSRNIHPGSLFIPLVGERFDGHAYINSALEGGAAGCLTQRERESYREDRFYIKVKDTQRALRDLAAWYKDRFPIPFVGVTGSVGKTTAKDMIAAVLGVKYKVLKTEGNFNNNIGLPLTLLRLDRTYQMGVLEMGMDRPGEIDYLGEIVNAGSIFLGRYNPEPMGDYFAGPNHTLPTMGTARFYSPLSVDDFIKKSQFSYYTREALERDYRKVSRFAKEEGLTAHARAVDIRFEKEGEA